MPDSETIRRVQRKLDRLEAFQAAIWPAALSGDPKAIDAASKIMLRRAKCLGFDPPRKDDLPHA